jgi:hypothetical protein
MIEKYFMNRFTGSVDTLENWKAETDDESCLIEVVESPYGVRCQNGKCWVSADE